MDDYLIEFGGCDYFRNAGFRSQEYKKGVIEAGEILPVHENVINDFCERGIENGVYDPILLRHASVYADRKFVRPGRDQRDDNNPEFAHVAARLAKAFEDHAPKERVRETLNRSKWDWKKLYALVVSDPHWYIRFGEEDQKFVAESYGNLILELNKKHEKEQVERAYRSCSLICDDLPTPDEKIHAARAKKKAQRKSKDLSDAITKVKLGDLKKLMPRSLKDDECRAAVERVITQRIVDYVQIPKYAGPILLGHMAMVLKTLDISLGLDAHPFIIEVVDDVRATELQKTNDAVLSAFIKDYVLSKEELDNQTRNQGYGSQLKQRLKNI